jgi:DNA-binding NarL/FixJ family response regulator
LTVVAACSELSIQVMASDGIVRDGLIAQLRAYPSVSVADDAESTADVTVVVADEVDESTLQLIRAAKVGAPSKVVLVVARLDEASVLAAVQAGVGSLLWRARASIGAVVDAARATADGHGVIPPELMGKLLNHLDVGLRPRRTPTGLTARELNVLRLLADGLDSAEVGRQLYYSERTIKSIIHDVTNRLNLRNRTHAVAYALRQGLI